MRGDIIYERGEHSLVNIVSGVDIIHRGTLFTPPRCEVTWQNESG